MRRVWVVIASAMLLASVGCGRESYVKRLDATLAKLDYDRRLKKNLMEAPKEDKKFSELTIYVRAPKEEARWPRQVEFSRSPKGNSTSTPRSTIRRTIRPCTSWPG